MNSLEVNPEKDFQFQNTKTESAQNFSASWIVPQHLAYFHGHFPQNPVLPAVAIMDVSIHLIRQTLNNHQLELSHLKNSKFTMPILPKMHIQILCQKIQNDIWSIEWKSEDFTQSYAKLELLLAST